MSNQSFAEIFQQQIRKVDEREFASIHSNFHHVSPSENRDTHGFSDSHQGQTTPTQPPFQQSEPTCLGELYSRNTRIFISRRPPHQYQNAPPPSRRDHDLNEAQQAAWEFINSHSPLSKSFSRQDLRSTFRKLAHRLHPDKGGNPAEFMRLRSAFLALKSVHGVGLDKK